MYDGDDAYDDDDLRSWDDSDDDDPHVCPCGRDAGPDACEQCGIPLCPMCCETGGGFCAKHPNDNYRPHEGDTKPSE